jgi:iron uptake system EfeUOB component EfeO/EfeM
MASLVDDLNNLIEKTRAGFEAAEQLAAEIKDCDPDIETRLEDIADAERWSSSGLYHRITQLDGTPNLLVSDFPSRIATKEALQDKIKMLEHQQEQIAREAKHILNRDDLNEPTQELLTEIRNLHMRNANWCKQILEQWKID